ncbi:hypothetical protein ACLBWX_20970 [Methylobacterium sp. M6A4_1b]
MSPGGREGRTPTCHLHRVLGDGPNALLTVLDPVRLADLIGGFGAVIERSRGLEAPRAGAQA